jgi:glycosyltransferase involved in cell wall biosynthesis
VRALRERGHDVRVLCTDTYLDVERPEDEDVDVHRALRWYWRDHRWPRRRLRDRRRVERHDRDVLALHVRDFAPDAIAFFAMGGLPMSLITKNRLPAVGVVHDDWLVYGPREDQWHRLLPWRRRRAHGNWLFVSAFTRDRALEAGWSLFATEVVPAGVDEAFRRPRPSPPWSWSLLFVGRLQPRKAARSRSPSSTSCPARRRSRSPAPRSSTPARACGCSGRWRTPTCRTPMPPPTS